LKSGRNSNIQNSKTTIANWDSNTKSTENDSRVHLRERAFSAKIKNTRRGKRAGRNSK